MHARVAGGGGGGGGNSRQSLDHDNHHPHQNRHNNHHHHHHHGNHHHHHHSRALQSSSSGGDDVYYDQDGRSDQLRRDGVEAVSAYRAQPVVTTAAKVDGVATDQQQQDDDVGSQGGSERGSDLPLPGHVLLAVFEGLDPLALVHASVVCRCVGGGRGGWGQLWRGFA